MDSNESSDVHLPGRWAQYKHQNKTVYLNEEKGRSRLNCFLKVMEISAEKVMESRVREKATDRHWDHNFGMERDTDK